MNVGGYDVKYTNVYFSSISINFIAQVYNATQDMENNYNFVVKKLKMHKIKCSDK